MPEPSSPTEDKSPPPAALGDIATDEMRALLHKAADWVANYREAIASRKISPNVKPGEIAAQFAAAAPEHAISVDEILAELDTAIVPGLVHWGHPMFLGYFGSTSNGPALIGEIITAALNVSAMTWRTSPAATELETVVLRWIREMVGLPPDMTGVVYDTASTGVLHALAAAREIHGVAIRQRGLAGRLDVPVFRVYASDQAHSSIEKAMIVLGLGEQNLVRVGTDAEFRMDVAALRSAIAGDVRNGFHPLAVVATVGTTSSVSVDAVMEVAAVAREFGAWLHVDAAYGGALGVLPEGRWAMRGVEQADSVIVNPHKWLFVPLDFSALYIRNADALRSVFALTPEYLQGDASSAGGGTADAARGESEHAIDYMDFSLSLGRRFRALKAWMVFRAFGRAGIEARIREHCRLAQEWARWVDAEEFFERAAPVTMAVVCFRYAPPDIDDLVADRLNAAIVDAVNASGEAYLTHTRLRGRVVMRVGIGNIATTEAQLASAWKHIVAQAHQAAVAR